MTPSAPLQNWYACHVITDWQTLSDRRYFAHIPERRILILSGDKNDCPRIQPGLQATESLRWTIGSPYYQRWTARLSREDLLEHLDDLFGADIWIEDTLAYKAGLSTQAALSKDRGLAEGLSDLRISAQGVSPA